MVTALLAFVGLDTLACAHVEQAHLEAGASVEQRRSTYDAKRAAVSPGELPAGSVFFSSPLRLRDGTLAAPADLAAAVADDSETARAVSRYQWLRGGFFTAFVAGGILEAAATASSAVGVALWLNELRDPKAPKQSALISAVGQIAEVTGYVVIGASYFLLAVPSVAAHDEAFRSYDADLKQHLGVD